MTQLTAQQVYDRLIEVDKILTLEGRITFKLGKVSIIVKQKDVVGNLLQEWLEGWLKANKIAHKVNPNSQMPPDFFLNTEDETTDLLEVKAFNYAASPGFDIADFKAYQQEIVKKPYMLHSKYLIFGYSMSADGVVTVKKLWLKNVWEICRTSEQWAINVQYKNGIVHKIRPATWYSENKRNRFKPFQCLEDFLAAIEETVYKNPDTRDKAVEWKERMEQQYVKHYNNTIAIPRWMDVRHKYVQ
ncbi:NgoBV family restriction endonuclease [Alloprevotella sp. Lung230]|uniref:NgoBV family restriction endonuclease n=1 Tax=Alloprevotella sp. Lung230 TaxID=2766595 RepID=UPI0016559591|nr:NgoBV family restriction endonuclease [Alloprevotella sp. Lung230]MBC8626715.1 NgoBV family restriction endonuclease [Alloprevotella sp. Lung230]